MPAQAATVVPSEGGEIWSSEYWTKKGDIPLWMFRKRIGAPKAGEPARPVVFFVHGSSVTSRVFDLNVPGKGEYSVMNEFARYGFDCWTMDHENYGKSGRTSGNADIASGVEDLKVAVELIARETGPAETALRRRILGRAARRRLCHGRAGAHRSAGVRRLHLQGRGLADPDQARRAARLFPHPQHAQARPRHDPLDRDPRQAGHLRSRRRSRRWRMPRCSSATRSRPAPIST